MKHLFSLLAISFFSIGMAAQQVTNLNDSGAGSLRQVCTNASPGDTVRFDPSLLNNGNATITLNSAIIINKGLRIVGLYNSTDTLRLSGGGTNRIFYFDNLASGRQEVYLDSLVMESGNASGNGGAIYVSGIDHLVVRNSVVKNSIALSADAKGGGLYAEATTVLLVDCSFKNNRADLAGGGLFSEGNILTISGCTFLNNSVLDGQLGAGGGISVDRDTVNIEHSVFESNSSAAYGGAISSNVDTIHFSAMNSRFSNNTSATAGGALRVNSDSSYFSECFFESNSTGVFGGAIQFSDYTFQGKVTLNRCTFLKNYAGTSGGSIYDKNINITIRSSSFMACNTGSGQGVSMRGLTLFSCDIINSTFAYSSSTSSSSSLYDFPTGQVNVKSSILHHYTSALLSGSATIVSGGANAIRLAEPWAGPTDQVLIDSATLALEPLDYYGGFVPTAPPMLSSPALNMGDSADFSPAQNGPIYGRRDVGAAERRVILYDTTLVCGSINWWGNTYNMAGTYIDTAFNANSIDSVGVLVLYSQDTSIANVNAVLIAQEQSPGTSYQWVNCDSAYAPISGATDSTFQPTVNGYYAVVLTQGNCSDTSACIFYDEVSISEHSTRVLRFYPNPTNGSIHLESSGELPSDVAVIDLTGRVIETLPVRSSELQLPNLKKGVYLLKWEFGDGRVQVDRVIIR